MVNTIDSIALFRLAVIGPLVSRGQLARGELGLILQEIGAKQHTLPCGDMKLLSIRTIERWYYAWLKGGIEALSLKTRNDLGRCSIPKPLQEQIIEAKKIRPARSINTIIHLMNTQGHAHQNELSRAGVHRLLKRHGLSKRSAANASTQKEHRSFEALTAGDIWYGDVMHGPSIHTKNGYKKTYLISVMDDASRLICHSAFAHSENNVAIEYVLKQAILKRGLPKKFVVDNGPAYRAKSLQVICARLKIHLIYCKPYSPEGKGKLERWHSTCRSNFLTEIELDNIRSLDDLNGRLWVWLEQFYHQTPHHGLKDKITPSARFVQDLIHIQPANTITGNIDRYFYHHHVRRTRKDGCISYNGQCYEVPHLYVGQSVTLLVDPFSDEIKELVNKNGESLGRAVLLDKHANLNRKRQQAVTVNALDDKPCDKNIETAYQHNKNQMVLPCFDTMED